MTQPDENEQRILGAWSVAAKALVRGGHQKEPSITIQTAATNWVINEGLSRFLLDAVETGEHNARLFAERGRLIFAMDGIDGIDVGSIRGLARRHSPEPE